MAGIDFDGGKFYKCGRYWSGKKKAHGEQYLHRAVWVAAYGPIPEGRHIHHIDGNPDNNAIENLEIMGASEHMSEHANRPARIEYAKWHMETRVRPRAIEWHGSKEGRKWHIEQGKRNAELPPRFEHVCEICGERFLSKTRKTRMCSRRCRAKEFRNRNPDYYTNEAKRDRLLSKRARPS
jgi:hypothetical protein